jgi:excisionase family DNA binding protein
MNAATPKTKPASKKALKAKAAPKAPAPVKTKAAPRAKAHREPRSEATLTFPEAAAKLGVSLRVLRQAIRDKRLPAPADNGATAHLSSAWLASVESAVKETPQLLNRTFAQKTPAFARYPGTSCWRKYPAQVREYARFQATHAE